MSYETGKAAEKAAQRAQAAQSAAAATVPLGSILRCDTCERTTHPHPVDIAWYFRHGWPTCHGATMRLLTPAEQGR